MNSSYDGICIKCGKPYIYVGDAPFSGWTPGSEPYCTCGQKETYSPTINQGWVCPVCGNVYAPWVSFCEFCRNRTFTTNSTNFKYNVSFGGEDEESKD